MAAAGGEGGGGGGGEGGPWERRPSQGAAAAGDALAPSGARSSMFPGADSASSTAGQPEAAGAAAPGPLGSHGPGGEARRRSAPAAAAVVGGGEEEAAEDEEDEDPGSSRFVLAAGLGLLAVSVVHLGQERAEAGGGGPPCLALLLLRLALYVGCAAAAAALGTLIVLMCRGRRRLPPPDFAAVAPVRPVVGVSSGRGAERSGRWLRRALPARRRAGVARLSLRRGTARHPNPVSCCATAAAGACPRSAARRGFKWQKLCWTVAGAPEKSTLCSGRDVRTAGMLARWFTVFAPQWLCLKSFSAPPIEMSLVKERLGRRGSLAFL